MCGVLRAFQARILLFTNCWEKTVFIRRMTDF